MILVLTVSIIALLIWLFIKFVLIEVPSLKIIAGMKKLHGPEGLPFFLGEAWVWIKMAPEDVLTYLKENSIKYPRVTAFYLAGIPMVLLHKPEDIKHILGSKKNIKKGIEYRAMAPWLNEGLLLSDDLKWHSRRKMLTPTFHFQILDESFNGIIKNSNILANKLSSTNGSEVIIDDYVTRCTLDIIGDTAMGVQLNAQNEPNNDYLTTVKRMGELVLERLLKVYLSNDLIFSWSSPGKHFYSCLKSLHSFTDRVIEERKKVSTSEQVSNGEDSMGRKKKKALLDSLLSIQSSDPKGFTDMDIREEVDTFMFEGHDTTSAAITFGLWIVGSYPDVQEKLYNELIEVVGDGEMTMKQISSLSYMEKVIKEIMRLYPSVPYISRSITEDVHLDGGIDILAGTNLVIIPFLLHRDEEFFPEPEVFNPERFSEELSKTRHPYAYLPFSAGPRNCIGQRFAMLEIKATFASVIRKCKIEAITKREDFHILPNMIIKATVPIKCKFTPRTR